MSDYLTNLATRSLESTPAIQPRLTSLFEPVRGLNLVLPEPERPATPPAIKPTLQTLPLPERKPDETGNPESNVAHAAPSPEKPGAPIVVPVIAFSSVHERADREVETSAEGARRALAET